MVQPIYIYRVQLTDEGFKIQEELSYEEFTSRMSNTAELRSNPNALSNGDFSFTTPGGNTYDVAGHAMQNNGGAHGAVEQSGPGFIWEGDAYCVTQFTENESRAVVGWEITDNTQLPPPLDVGFYIYTAVEDNGEGSNAPSDRVSLNFYIAPPGSPAFCDVLANDASWPEENWVDVNEGGHIQVQ